MEKMSRGIRERLPAPLESASPLYVPNVLNKSNRSLRGFPAGFWLAGLALLGFTSPGFTAPIFIETNTPLPAVAYSSVVTGDFNNDGKPDVLISGADSGFVGINQIWQYNSSGSYTNLGMSFPGISSSAVARGDFDNDGRLDLLITGFTGLSSSNTPVYVSQVWRNLGNGSFTNIQAGLPGVDTGAVAWGDFDGDGNLDFLLTGFSSTGAVAQVWRNRGNGTFTNSNAGLPGVLYSAVALGDYDNDGALDILLAGTPNGFSDSAFTQLWRNRGDGTFTNVPIALPGVSQGSLAWADFDQDGRLDILVAGFAGSVAVCQIWKNLGNGNFSNARAGLPGIYRGGVAVADFDNDGRPDIALAGAGNQGARICQLWRNTGGTFENTFETFPGVQFGSIAWADLNSDGRLDLIISGLDTSDNPILRVYRNNTAATNSSTVRISNLKIISGGSSHLSFAGQSGYGYRVLGSSDLNQWTVLGSANESGPGKFSFRDTKAGVSTPRFYRLNRQ